MSSALLKKLHDKNQTQIIEKMYNGSQLILQNMVNAPINFRLYGMSYQIISDDYVSDMYSLSNVILKIEGANGEKNFTKVPFVGNAIEVTDKEKANLFFDGRYYIADYIEYNSYFDTAYRYKFINTALINNNIPLVNQLQAVYEEPVIETIIPNENEYAFNKLKTCQGKCSINLISDNQINLNDFLNEDDIANIVQVEVDEKKLIRYTGDKEFLFCKNYFCYDDDYIFSFKTSAEEKLIVRFFDENKNNISNEVVELIKDGLYNEVENGIEISSSDFICFYKENENIVYFQVGFKVENEEYFSDLKVVKNLIKNTYLELNVKSLKDIELDFEEYIENSKYFGKRISDELEQNEIFHCVDNKEYLYYKFFIPYNNNYLFSYQINSVGEIIVQFFDEYKNNISFEEQNILQDGIYNEEHQGIIVNSKQLTIPYLKENKNISYFKIGFKVFKKSIFSNLSLKKQQYIEGAIKG